MNRILIIGGASKDAQNLIEEKLANGFEVVCIDNFSKSDINNIEKFYGYKNFIFIKHDINMPFFIEVSEVYNFISNMNESIKGNIEMIREKNGIEMRAESGEARNEYPHSPMANSPLIGGEPRSARRGGISIIGTGYVGLTTAAILSGAGYKVYTVDVDENKINTVKSGKSYFFEP